MYITVCVLKNLYNVGASDIVALRLVHLTLLINIWMVAMGLLLLEIHGTYIKCMQEYFVQTCQMQD